ncbi:MAG: ATP-binding protein [Lachnospiraceae bacterium]|nr:ATP-binding protein [Lachnospiraceae bacterium]
MSNKKRMPIGIDDFNEIITQNFYYVDKTGMIKELLDNWGKVNLFTRPRRFGKSINMSMLRNFFEIGTDKSLFNGLDISKETDLCEEYMGQFPVISISLKQVSGSSFERAVDNIRSIIGREAQRFPFLLESGQLDEDDKWILRRIRRGEGMLDDSLYDLSRLLCKHFGKKVIILIDEYDAPIQNAYEKGYYDEMVGLIRQIFGYALKSNESLFFGVLTGCMRISKESLFSDLNNPKIYSLVDEGCDEWFGFTNYEVKKLLDDYDLNQYYEITKDWYDGYRIGVMDIYCPWDVINWCDQLLTSADKTPENYWTNSGENSIINRFAWMSEDSDRYDLEVLSEGGYVDKKLNFEQSYKDLYSSVDNLWSVLFAAGYLTQRGRNEDGTWRLAIPNREIRRIFADQIEKWFMVKMEGGLRELYGAFDEGNAEKIEKCINTCLKESISFMDGGNTEEQKESSYHMLLVGMVKGRRDWVIKSNREAGKGRADIIIIDRLKKEGTVIEVKHTDDDKQLEAKAAQACRQMKDMDYREYFLGFQISKIKEYGIAFCGKECRVLRG